MDTVTLSPKFQVVIPQRIREALELRPGTKFQVVSYDGRIEFVPVMEMKKARGFLRLASTDIDRADSDRL
jgi:AbrB family looped-hinge helix DNA binding protein